MNREEALASERAVLQLVGLARRAGRAVVGTRSVKDAARRGEVTVAIVAEDATANARDRLRALEQAAVVEVVTCGTKEALGRAVGRREAVVVGIADRGLGGRAVEEAARRELRADPQ